MKKILIVVLIAIILSSFISCRSGNTVDDTKPKIVVTYSILGSIVKNLVGEQANVITSIPNGLDPHEWKPSAKDIEAINKADFVVCNGLGLEAGMGSALQRAQESGVPLFYACDYVVIRYIETREGNNSDNSDHVTGAPDPHLWLDPIAMKSVVTGLAGVLRTELGLDVSIRAVELANELDYLNGEVTGILSVIPPDDRKLVTGHEAMGYFAERYGFTLVGVIIPSLSSQAESSAADMAAVKKAIEDNGVKAIFTEPGVSPDISETIGNETGARVIELAVPVLPDDGSYFTFLTGIAKTIAEALQ